METKVCTKCGRELPIVQFNWKDKAKGTRHADCKECHSEFMKIKYQEKKDLVQELKSKDACAKCGAKLVCETDIWKIYSITTLEASKKYGRDTKWCISGTDNTNNYYWQQYIKYGIKFYFLITKNNYNARGNDSKYAIIIINNKYYEAFDQQDNHVKLNDIIGIDNVVIPGVNLATLQYKPMFINEGPYL